MVSWETLFHNNTVNKEVSILNETIVNVFSNFVRSKLITFDNSNHSTMNDFMQNKIKGKYEISKNHVRNGRKDSDYVKFQEATSYVSEIIFRRKVKYQSHIALNLNDPMTNTKTSLSIFKTFCDGKKVPIIPPLVVNDESISDFEKKANCFNKLLHNDSVARV